MERTIIEVSGVWEQELLNHVNVFLREVRLLTSKDPFVMGAAQTATILHARKLEAGMFSFIVKTQVPGMSGRHFLKVRDVVSLIPFGDPELESSLGDDLLDVAASDVITAIREALVRRVLRF